MNERFGPERRGRWLLLTLEVIFGVCFLAATVWSLILLHGQYRARREQAELIALYEQAQTVQTQPKQIEPEITPGPMMTPEPYIDPLRAINSDYLGWLRVYGTDVDYPVVLGADNEYYLEHSFYGERRADGCLFADSLCDGSLRGNLIIYGHHMMDGSMFGSLKNIKNGNFFEDYGFLTWDSGGKLFDYEIFAALVIPGYPDDADYFPIQDYVNEINVAKRAELMKELRRRAVIWEEGVNIPDGKPLMFLITCDYTRTDGRLMICAVRR